MSSAVGFSNGIGNLVIFSSIMKCLESHFGEKLDFVYDSTRKDKVQLEVLEMASRLSSVKRVVDFWDAPIYDNIFMSRHNNYCQLYEKYVKISSENEFDWALSGISEIAYYYYEIRTLFGYKKKLFPQEVPFSYTFDTSVFGKYFCISNSFNNYGGNSMERKSYPWWGEVIRTLSKLFPKHKFITLGGASDLPWASKLKGTVNMAGKLNLLESAALIAKSDGVLSTDTGMFHVADGLKKPTVVIFGPTLTSKNGPLNDTTIIVQSPASCAPCQGREGWFLCEAEKARCMSFIKPSYVVSAFLSILSKCS